ncbi:MAG: ATP-binding protein, partial [Vicinamibacteraceae bacterium]
SLAYFAHVSRRLALLPGTKDPAAAQAVGTLANAMLRFVGEPSDERAITAVSRSLADFAQRPVRRALREDARALVAHGRLILTTLPASDNLLNRLLTARITGRGRVVQDLVAEDYRRSVSRARVFRILLYVTAVSLVLYLGHLYLRLRASAKAVAEKAELEARLHDAQRLEAIGTLAGGIAHNLGNVLGAILGYAEMALARLTPNSGPWRHVLEIKNAGERARSIVDQILAFGRRSEYKREPLPLQPVIEEAVSLLRAMLPSTVTIRTTLDAGNATVRGSWSQLQQVVMNLCTNAAHAMSAHGQIDIVLDTIDNTHEWTLSHGTLPPGAYARLSVTDTGHGMSRSTMERIFDPFFTTKPPGSGTGLGLSTVHGIMLQHGGALTVCSRPGAGTTFEAYLPCAETAPADRGVDPARRSGEQPPPGHGETILLVDHEKHLMLRGEEMLASLGYEPVGFDSGTQALAALRTKAERFDLLLADEAVPDITTTELAAAARDARPDLPIVLMTSLAGVPDLSRLRHVGICDVIRKPLLAVEVAEALARHLQRPRVSDVTKFSPPEILR